VSRRTAPTAQPCHRLAALLCGGLVLTIAACGTGESPEQPKAAVEAVVPVEQVSVFTVNYPLAYFAERIGGDRVSVSFPAPPEIDPAEWSPPSEVAAEYQQADLILLNGAGYASWIDKVALPSSKLVDTSRDLADQLISVETITHSHGPEGDHSHAARAITVWLDPRLAAAQAARIAEALARVDAAGSADYEAGLAALTAELDALDGELEAALAALAGDGIVFSHPVYQYLARRYGIEHRAVHWKPGAVPQAEEWHQLDHLVRHGPARWMLWEGEPHPDVAAELTERGLSSIVYDPSANRPRQGDFLQVMRQNVERLRSAAP
jgi:zinc transport system substrate-binding protein